MLADDSGDGVVRTGQVDLVLKAFGTKGSLLAQLDDLAFQSG